MSDAIEEIEKDGLIGRIVVDEDPENPRTGYDNLGKMLCFHRRYDLGDKHDIKSKDFSSWDEIEEHLKKELDAVIILPLFLYDHGGLRMKVGSFQGYLPQGHAEFDSGQVGFIYVTREAILKEYSVKEITDEVLKTAQSVLEGEVETYDQYLSGQVYGYQIVKPEKCSECGTEDEEVLDSCYGFYGEDYATKEMKDALDYAVKKASEKK